MLPQLPGMKDPAGSAEHPRLERFKRLLPNPTHNVGILVGGGAKPMRQHFGVQKLACGGIVGDYADGGTPYSFQDSLDSAAMGDNGNSSLGGGAPLAAPDSGYTAPAGWMNPDTIDNDVKNGSASDGENSGSIGPDNSSWAKVDNDTSSPKNGGGKIADWLQGTHGGLTGKSIVQAGLTALTGILSGVASKKVPKAPANPANSVNPAAYGFGYSLNPNAGGIGVKLGFADGGSASGAGIMPQASPGPSNGQGDPLLQAVVAALTNHLPKEQAKVAIRAFVAKNGVGALKQLVSQLAGGGQGGGQQQPQAPAAPSNGVMVPPDNQQMAGGGHIQGPGTGTSDSVVANNGAVNLSNGEYVLTKKFVDKVGNGDNKRGASILDAFMTHHTK